MTKICDKHPDAPRYRYKCLECHRKSAREWNSKNREHCRRKNREYHKKHKESIKKRKQNMYYSNIEKARISAKKTMLKIKYGLSMDEFNSMLLSQNNVCAICNKPETQRSNKNGVIDSLRVDHCHTIGIIRGLLCSKCNFGIGQFNDDILLLEKAIIYLNKYILKEQNEKK